MVNKLDNDYLRSKILSFFLDRQCMHDKFFIAAEICEQYMEENKLEENEEFEDEFNTRIYRILQNDKETDFFGIKSPAEIDVKFGLSEWIDRIGDEFHY